MQFYAFLTILTFVVLPYFDQCSPHPAGYSNSEKDIKYIKDYVKEHLNETVVYSNSEKDIKHIKDYVKEHLNETVVYSNSEKDIEHIKDHVKEHLNDTVDYSRMSEREYLMGYFRTHDTDGDDRLDGVEMVHALIDHYHHEKSYRKSLIFTDRELEFFIDLVLKKEDVNNDGFLDFREYMIAQTKKNRGE